MDFDKKLLEQVCREYVSDSVNLSKNLRSRLSLLEHAKVYNWAKNESSYNQLLTILISEGSGPVSKEVVIEFETLVKLLVEDDPTYRWPPFKGVGTRIAKSTGKFMTKERHPVKFLKKAALVTAIILAAIYLYKKLKDPCIRQCLGKPECIKNCKIAAMKKSIVNLQSHMGACKDTPNPEKCQAKIKKEIGKWTDKIRKVESGK